MLQTQRKLLAQTTLQRNKKLQTHYLGSLIVPQWYLMPLWLTVPLWLDLHCGAVGPGRLLILPQ
jgi:hypothetical protein